ncbi:Predicted dehydrogenase [Streptomyces sp. DvalAA-14]|uniref:Gfo/Idh/MocA family protein n=1 Tax=unclassified Streptomyces TaxID=2593676 RepID=UPI00081BAAF2|nr:MULTISPECIES: Gfo/Idh/MocA family oxidoreductase [unclassified Streptomyces]MYS19495.1 Gfo/Idh/MocA family oxidoreductase [Streptomyces sp. SID4948]SCD45892.1 Predicted dehydrogenase [Streptomyces sp. DvalAA-14]
MAELRVGVVGIGQRAPLVRHANRPGVARVVSCADPDPRARATARELFGPQVAVHDAWTRMLDDRLDAVFVLTPDHVHTAPVRFFLAAGVAVFVEKPLAIGVDDCDEMLADAARTGTRLYVGHNLRHLPVLRRMRALIDAGAIGRVRSVWCRHFVGHGGDYYFKDWHAERANTTGLLLQKGAHDLDAVHWLAAGYSRTVVALGGLTVYGDNPHRRDPRDPDDGRRMPDWFDPGAWPPSALRDLNPVIDVEDLSMMLTRLDNGVFTSYQQCHYTPDYWRNYTVIGDEGRLENFGDGLDEEEATVRVWNLRRSGYRPDADLTVTVAAPPGRPPDLEGPEDPEDPEDPEGGHGGADGALVAEFLRFAAEGGPTETSPIAAREAVAAGVAATVSLRSGGTPVRVRPPDPATARYFARHQTR